MHKVIWYLQDVSHAALRWLIIENVCDVTFFSFWELNFLSKNNSVFASCSANLQVTYCCYLITSAFHCNFVFVAYCVAFLFKDFGGSYTLLIYWFIN